MDDLHKQTHDEDTQHIEEEDSIKGLLRRLRDDPARILCLRTGKCNNLDIPVAESCTDQGRPEGKKLSCVSVDKVAVESTWVAPVAKAYSFMIWSATEINDDSCKDETNDQSDFHGCEDDLRLFQVSHDFSCSCI